METQNLILRQFCLDDFQDFSELIRDKMNSEYAICDEPFPTDDEGLKGVLSYFKDSNEFWAIEIKVEKRVIGFVSLNYVDDSTRNLGYCIHTAYHKKGYATEVVKEIKEYAKNNLKLSKLISGTAEANIPSVKLLENMGFIMTGKAQGSFANDRDGNPIIFMGCSFECTL